MHGHVPLLLLLTVQLVTCLTDCTILGQDVDIQGVGPVQPTKLSSAQTECMYRRLVASFSAWEWRVTPANFWFRGFGVCVALFVAHWLLGTLQQIPGSAFTIPGVSQESQLDGTTPE